MSRFAFAFLATIPFCSAQNFPAFNWIQEVDGSGMDQFTGIGADAAGNVYVVGSTTSPNFPVKSAVQNHLASPGRANCFVTKLDSAGNVIYSTYFGGSGGDAPAAMTVDSSGNVYVTGNTGSRDFPTTKGVYAPSFPSALPGIPNAPNTTGLNASFLFKLNSDGSLGYSTYFAFGQAANSVATDQNGSAYIAGRSLGGLPTTPGAYRTLFDPPVVVLCLGPLDCAADSFLTRFDAAGSTLIYSTYLGTGSLYTTSALAVAADGIAYVGSEFTLQKIDATGSYLLAASSGLVYAYAMAIAADGSLYVAGSPGTFQPTLAAFQTSTNAVPILPTDPAGSRNTAIGTADAIVRMDPQLQHVLAGTYFYGITGSEINSLALDAAGNVYVGGFTALGLPTRTPLFGGFGAGFLSELSGDLTTLLFSSYFGSDTNFYVQGVAVESNGSVLIGGPQTVAADTANCRGTCSGISPGPANIWANSLTLAAPPALRIDSIVNAGSFLDGPISPGETIFVRGAGFGSDAQLLIGGTEVPSISTNATQITAIVPSAFPVGPAEVVVQSGGSASNQVLAPMTVTSPGIFSANGNGYGQGFIFNNDGTLNTPSNPAAPGDTITIYATGVGPVSFRDGYAVTQYPANVFIDGYYCDGVAAFWGPVAGLAGNVY
jgi:uncharacterized protein (TIGR03437 family)